MNETLHLIIPMAGVGRRFREAGYTQEKPLIEIGGKTLLGWSLLPVVPLFDWEAGRSGRLIFILRDDKDVGVRTEELCGQVIYDTSPFFVGVTKSLQLCGPTQGAACSVLAAAVGLPPDDPVMVMNADQYFKVSPSVVRRERWTSTPNSTSASVGAVEVPGLQGIYELAMMSGWDGFILTFLGTGPAWSYAVTNGTNRVVHVIEKKEVSKFATCGLYWWRRAGDLVRSVCAMIASGQKTSGEFFLAPSFNFLPLSDKNIQIVQVEEFHGLGTPEQVKEFEALLAGGWMP